MARRIAIGHSCHRPREPVCGGWSFGVVVDVEEHVFVANFLVDNYLRIEQTQRAPEREQCETADKGAMLLMKNATAAPSKELAVRGTA